MIKKLLYISIVIIISTIAVSVYISKTKITTIPVNKDIAPTNIVSSTSTTALRYIEVVDSCDFAFIGGCVNVRSGPGEKYPAVSRLRKGVVLLVDDTITENNRTWYKIGFAHELLYPERINGDWYVAADLVNEFADNGDHALSKNQEVTTNKRITVDVSEQKLYAHDGDTLFMEESISTGLELTPTARGTFTIFKMTPARFMQGPIPGVSNQKYDLPGVPWDLYFTQGGSVIHGAYWHNNFGKPWSHGCVNLSPEKAKKLYMWATIGIPVTVQD